MTQRPITREDYEALKGAYGIGPGFYGDTSLQIARAQNYYGEKPLDVLPKIPKTAGDEGTSYEPLSHPDQQNRYLSGIPQHLKNAAFLADFLTAGGIQEYQKGVSPIDHAGNTIDRTLHSGVWLTGYPTVDEGYNDIIDGASGERLNPMLMVKGAGKTLLGTAPINPLAYARPLATLGTGLLASNVDTTMPEQPKSQQQQPYNRMMAFAQPQLRGY